jgi:hypothetical protein
MGEALDKLLASYDQDTTTAQGVLAIRGLATNKDVRLFLTALNRYSDSQWREFLRVCRIVGELAGADGLAGCENRLAAEMAKYPHIAKFMTRLYGE